MKVIGFIFFLTLIFFIGIVSAGDTTTFRVDVLGPDDPIISVQVPDSIYLGEVHVGEQTDDIRVDINNTGNVAIIVTPRLVSGANDLFDYLYFKRITSEPYYQVGEYNHNITAPTSSGARTSYMYVKLDLRDYDGVFNSGSTNRISSDVKFVAIAQ